MTEVADRNEGWHIGRCNGSSEWQGGPYTWEQLISFAREGRLSASDLVWYPTMSEWLPAQEVPGPVLLGLLVVRLRSKPEHAEPPCTTEQP